MSQAVKNLPAMQETWFQSLSWKDPLEELGNPLQYSCLADSIDRAVWWATVHVVAKNWTRLSDTHFKFQEWARCMEISQAFFFFFGCIRYSLHHAYQLWPMGSIVAAHGILVP